MTRLSASIRKLQRALMTTVFNGAGEGSAKASWVLMRRTRADTFRSANRRKNLHRFSMLHVAEPKNRTCIGPHPRTPKKPTISVVERGYVRRSEFELIWDCSCSDAANFCAAIGKVAHDTGPLQVSVHVIDRGG